MATGNLWRELNKVLALHNKKKTLYRKFVITLEYLIAINLFALMHWHS